MTRVEDGPLLRGQGRFVDDLPMPDALHVAFLRSPVAHGRLKGIDAGAARAQPGVHAVLTFADLRPLLTSDRIPQALPSGAIRFHVDPQVLVKDEATYVGEPIAHGRGGEPRRIAEDALPLIELDIEPLPAVHRSVSRGSSPARRRRGWTARTISWRARASTTATSTARSPRRRIASRNATGCTRAAAIRSRRAASRCGSIPSTTR